MTKIIDFLKYVNDNTEFRKKIEEKENLYGLNSKKTKESYKIF